MDNLIKYSMQIAMLNHLMAKKLITQKEYTAIKNDLMKTYKIKNLA